jgi:GntR family transcriptional regulator
MLTITIDRDLETPVYSQVAHQVRQLIAAGALTPGSTLPSVRRLASDLGVNLNTVARAYRLLEDEGFLEIRGRSGVKVAPPADKVRDGAHAALLDELRVTLARFRQAGVTREELLDVVSREVRGLTDRSTEESDE